jgi:hypothetical protein
MMVRHEASSWQQEAVGLSVGVRCAIAQFTVVFTAEMRGARPLALLKHGAINPYCDDGSRGLPH